MEFLSILGPGALIFCGVVALLAGLVKGLVGFAMPMILVSGLGSVVGPELALAGLILPTLVTNGFQALAQGPRVAWEAMYRFRVFLGFGLAFLVLSAQLFRLLDTGALLLLIGVPITLFAASQLAGMPLRLPNGPSRRAEMAVGSVAGFIGGLSGVWGPPTVAYLTALGTEKTVQIRVQGVIYGLGAIALLAAHVGSGVFNRDTAPFSVALLVPALAGMWAGSRLRDRIDQAAFRRATLLVLLIAGLNLIRRGVLAL